jgi:phage-related tail fiber protein
MQLHAARFKWPRTLRGHFVFARAGIAATFARAENRGDIIMKNWLSAVLAIASLGLLLPGSAFAQSAFDGQWNFSVTSRQAPGCGAATYPYVFAIRSGAVTPISGPSRLSTLFASVDASGKIGGVVAARRDRSTASGRLQKNGTGSGVWASQDWGCAGTWTARRVS